MAGQAGFFDVDERLRRLSDLGDQLLAFVRVVDFEIFRPGLAKALTYSGGRLSTDFVEKPPTWPLAENRLRRCVSLV